MKILRFVYDWPPPWNGLAPHPYEMSVAQSDLGHKVEVICGRWPKAGDIATYPNITLHPFWREPLKGTVTLTTSVIAFLFYYFWRLKPANKVDVIHTHGHFAIWLFFYRLILKKLDKTNNELSTPLVAHFHNVAQARSDALEERNIPITFHSKFLAWPMEKLSNKWAVKVADALVFVSEDNKNEAIKLYNADPAKCFVVESGVNVSAFKPIGAEEKDKTRKEIGLDPLDKVVMNNGQMIERKNIHLLVEALEFLPIQYKLLLIGGGDKDYIERMTKLIAEKNLKDRVLRTGYVPYPELPISFQASDIFVLPSSYEGMPKVVMQSLACRVPVLGSAFKVNEPINGLYYLENLDPKEIAVRIQEIVDGRADVGVEVIAAKFSWKEKAKQVGKIYEFVIKSKNV